MKSVVDKLLEKLDKHTVDNGQLPLPEGRGL